MTNPRSGLITREWVVETITQTYPAATSVALSSQKHPYVSEAIPLGGYTVNNGTQLAITLGAATVIAHDRAFPDQGTVSATQAATLAPQQFLVAGLNTGTQISAIFLIRGR